MLAARMLAGMVCLQAEAHVCRVMQAAKAPLQGCRDRLALATTGQTRGHEHRASVHAMEAWTTVVRAPLWD